MRYTVHIIVITIQHRTVLVIFPLMLQRVIIAQMLSTEGESNQTDKHTTRQHTSGQETKHRNRRHAPRSPAGGEEPIRKTATKTKGDGGGRDTSIQKKSITRTNVRCVQTLHNTAKTTHPRAIRASRPRRWTRTICRGSRTACPASQ